MVGRPRGPVEAGVPQSAILPFALTEPVQRAFQRGQRRGTRSPCRILGYFLVRRKGVAVRCRVPQLAGLPDALMHAVELSAILCYPWRAGGLNSRILVAAPVAPVSGADG